MAECTTTEFENNNDTVLRAAVCIRLKILNHSNFLVIVDNTGSRNGHTIAETFLYYLAAEDHSGPASHSNKKGVLINVTVVSRSYFSVSIQEEM